MKTCQNVRIIIHQSVLSTHGVLVEDRTFDLKVQETASDAEGAVADLTPTRSHPRSSNEKHWKVPFFPCSSFTRRKKSLQRILDYFASHVIGYQRRFAIYGLEGVGMYAALVPIISTKGKTQLALMFAFQERSKYSGVFFDADSETTLHEDFARIHNDLNLDCLKDKVSAVKRWFDLKNDVN